MTVRSQVPQESLTQSLLKAVTASLTRDTVLTILASDSDAMRRIALQWLLANMSPEEVGEILSRGLVGDDRTCLGVLEALKDPDIALTEGHRRQAASFLQHRDSALRRSAVQLIVSRWPEDAIDVLKLPDCQSDYESLRLLCRTEDANLIMPLLDAFGFPRRNPPPTIGLMVNSLWLAEHHAVHPDAVEWLARECGYCEQPVTPDVIELFSLGFSYVAAPMTAAGPAVKWQERLRTLTWQLLPESAGISLRDRKPLNLNDPIDLALFLVAVRDTDRRLFSARQLESPCKSGRLSSEVLPVCFHAPARFVRRLFLTDARQFGGELAVPDERISEFILDYARFRLEPDELQNMAADRELRTKWRSRGCVPAIPPRQIVIGRYVRSEPDALLSPCAKSVCRLAEAAGLESTGLARRLRTCEDRWSRLGVPIGIELQIPKVDPNLFGAWKEALTFLGIPSPHRPEFGGMLEAAFRPARSFHSILLTPLLLHKLSAISKDEPQDIAMHISLQGDLGSHARYLAFPQLFINPSQRLKNRPDSAMTRVMSKGLVHRNTDVELLEPRSSSTDHQIVRTELRMFRLFSDEVDGLTNLSLSYLEDILATHLIGSSILGDCAACRELASDYCADIESEMALLPAEFTRLLQSNFYQSTGDPRDESLLGMLPIFRTWREVRKHVRERDHSAELDQFFRSLRSRHLQRLIEHFRIEHSVDVEQETAELLDFVR